MDGHSTSMYQVVTCVLEGDIRVANDVDDSGKARVGQDDVNSATSNVHVNVGIVTRMLTIGRGCSLTVPGLSRRR